MRTTSSCVARSQPDEAFIHTANYDGAVANWFLEQEEAGWNADAAAAAAADFIDDEGEESLDAIFEFDEETGAKGTVGFEVFRPPRVGNSLRENSHHVQHLAEHDGVGIAQATQLHGKPMSYNNYVDADAALRAAYDHELPAVAIIKHANPCGIAVSEAASLRHTSLHTSATRYRHSVA